MFSRTDATQKLTSVTTFMHRNAKQAFSGHTKLRPALCSSLLNNVSFPRKFRHQIGARLTNRPAESSGRLTLRNSREDRKMSSLFFRSLAVLFLFIALVNSVDAGGSKDNGHGM
jgi:hypothetical protein